MLREMPRVAKLQLMEALWDDLSHDAVDVASPAWHGEVLAARAAKVAAGTAEFFDWEVVKASLLKPRA